MPRSDTLVRRSVLRRDIESAIADGAADPELRLQDVADAVFASPRQVQRVLAGAGTTFEATLRQARIRRARALLVETPDLSRKELARQCGYRQAKYLSRALQASSSVPDAG